MMNITLVEGLPFKVPEIEYIGDTLPWHPTLKWEQRDPSTIKRVIVHHMASDAPLVNQAKYHINAHGWPGLSYTLAVSDGRLKQINDPCSITYHAAGNNDDTICIAIHGDLSKRELRQDERDLLYAGILSLKSMFPIEEVLGHNEVNPTACPCTSMNQIREDIQKIEVQMEINRRMNTDSKSVQRKILRATDQHVYLYNTYNSDKVKYAWLEPHLLELYNKTKELGLFFGTE